jgi:hypothetical protein
MRHDSCYHGNILYSHSRHRGSGSSVNQQLIPYAYQEDTDKKNQRQALLDKVSVPPAPDEDGPAIMDATAPAGDQDDGTYEIPSK